MMKLRLACLALLAFPATVFAEQDRLKNAEKAFWDAPSFLRLEQVGEHLNWYRLSEQQRAEELKTHRPIRFAVPQFNAMKRKLEEGVVPRFENEVSRIEASALTAPATRQEDSETTAHLKSFFRPELLPAAAPSMFVKQSDVLLSIESDVDSVTAMIGAPSTMRVIRGPAFEQGHQDEGINGFWDIGELEIRYAHPVVLQVIGRQGLLGAIELTGDSLRGLTFNENCAEGYIPLPAGKHLDGYPNTGNPLVAFHARTTLPPQKLAVLTRKFRVQAAADPYSGPPDVRARDILVHQVDLNGDRRPDIAVLEGESRGVVSDTPVSWSYYFVNIAGSWWYVGFDSYGECS